ncbi:helix-turn-helix domain-containing protein [Nocardioides sp.]|uniref:helix-turn-helix domain-containing protein n=1 Tax=Nocardioides sp. TaxID=35761 RepID=UPI003517251F
MQELLGRIARLDPSASLGLRVIACFDELVVGHVNTRGLLAAAASLAGCPAGFRRISEAACVRVGPKGDLLDGPAPEVPAALRLTTADGLEVWLERDGEPAANDGITLERLSLAVRARHGLVRRDDIRRHAAIMLDRQSSAEERVAAAEALGLTVQGEYRIAAAPLFAQWQQHPGGPEDVIPTRHGPMHVVVLPAAHDTVVASPCGLGTVTPVDRLHESFRVAVVALRLCSPPEEPLVDAHAYGGLLTMLADTPEDSHQPDVERMAEVATRPWGLSTVAALLATQSIREAARHAGVHHSTLQSRVDVVSSTLGFDPLDGLGRARLGIAFLSHRLRHSTVLELPPPAS